MKTLIISLFIIQAQGKTVIVTAQDRAYLGRYNCHITHNVKNNDLADNAIALLSWRDKKK